MFTGLVEAVGQVSVVRDNGLRLVGLEVPWGAGDAAIGDSIAIDGCCLTVVRKDGTRLFFEAAQETRRLTTIGDLQEGSRVNLERALKVGDRLGGHLVQGHVDGVAEVIELQTRAGTRYITLRVPGDVAELSCTRGSVCLAGVSLTVVALQGDAVTVAVIPHTLEVTTVDQWSVGTRVNIEADLVGRYLHQFWMTRRDPVGDRP